MNSQKSPVSIPCPLHPSEFIQRIALDPDVDKHVFCLECILDPDNKSYLPPDLKNLNDFIEIAAGFYTKNTGIITPTSQAPSEYFELLSKQGQNLEAVSHHIENEKRKVEEVFEKLKEDFLKVINEKKNEYLYSLDQQLFNLHYWYIFFEKQVKKAHPTEEDIPLLFPSKEDLNNRLQKITNATQLTAFVRNIKEDLNDHKLDEISSRRKNNLEKLADSLRQLSRLMPSLDDEKIDVSSIQVLLKENLEDELDKILILKDEIKDVHRKDPPSSEIITRKDFVKIREWLPKQFKFNPKLIYRATRDGMDPFFFHKYCDEKGPTITIIKCELGNNQKAHVVGGFLDKSWKQDQNDSLIRSSNAFLFSLTSGLKFVVDPSRNEAAYGVSNQGPLFGAGYDLGVTEFKNYQNYSYPCSYLGTRNLFRNESEYPDCEIVYFKVLELEVYTIL